MVPNELPTVYAPRRVSIAAVVTGVLVLFALFFWLLFFFQHSAFGPLRATPQEVLYAPVPSFLKPMAVFRNDPLVFARFIDKEGDFELHIARVTRSRAVDGAEGAATNALETSPLLLTDALRDFQLHQEENPALAPQLLRYVGAHINAKKIGDLEKISSQENPSDFHQRFVTQRGEFCRTTLLDSAVEQVVLLAIRDKKEVDPSIFQSRVELIKKLTSERSAN